MRDPIASALRTAKGYGRRYADGGSTGDPYTTELDPAETDDFAGWKQKYAPHDSGADYDLQGAYKAGMTPDPETGHFDDRFKKPNHPTFSTFSQYAKDRPDLAGTWVGDQYIPARMQGMPTDDPAAMVYGQVLGPTKPTVMQPDLQSMQTGQQDVPEGYAVNDAGIVFNKKTGEELQQTRRPGLLPITKTPEGSLEFANPRIADIASNMGAGWSVPVQGAEHVLGAGLAVPKAAKAATPAKVGRAFDLAPAEVKAAQPIGGSLGTSKGSVFTGFADGVDRYIKEAKSWAHAEQEVLASKLYEAAGVPVAKNELTMLNGKPAISSHLVEGDQLSHFDPGQYKDINNLERHMPADAWLANGDVLGAGTENPKGNVMVRRMPNGQLDATRIDFGGALGFSGLGGPKAEHLWGNSAAPYLEGLRDPDRAASEVFGSHVLSPYNTTAQRIAAIPDKTIRDIVASTTKDKKLADKLIARRDSIAEAYGFTKPEAEASNVVPLKPKNQTFDELQAEWEEKLAQHQTKVDEADPYSWGTEEPHYSFKDPKKDASTLLSENLYPAQLDEHGQPHKEGGFDTHAIANDMYHMAEKNPAYVDQVFKELPEHIQEDVNAKLSQKIQREGDPWSAPDVPPDLAPAPKGGKGEGIGGNFKLMQLNKTHNTDQLVNSIKAYHKDEVTAGKTVTAKQKDKIAEMITAAPTMQVAAAIKKLDPEEIKNVLSWVPPAKAANIKHLAKAEPEKAAQPIPDIGDIKKNHSLYQIINAVKNYSPLHAEVPYHAYQSVPKEISKYSPAEIMKEMENLSLNQKQKVMMWLPESTKEKMVQIGEANLAKKQGFVGQEYYDALENVDWQNYKPKGATSARAKIPGKKLSEVLAQGYNPDISLYKGGKYHSGYPETVLDPLTEPHRLADPDEKAFFLSDHPAHAAGYGSLGGEYIARPEKVFKVDWKELTGSEDYSSHHMKRIIAAAREKGADLVIVKNVADVSTYGHSLQDQYAFLNTHVLRGPEAKFDPNSLHLRKPLAGLVGGGLFSYGMLRGQEGEEAHYARGGGVKVPKASVNYSKGMENSHCGICTFYHDKTCSKVQGPIDWSMWCKLYKAKE
jgi:hypothetical protein